MMEDGSTGRPTTALLLPVHVSSQHTGTPTRTLRRSLVDLEYRPVPRYMYMYIRNPNVDLATLARPRSNLLPVSINHTCT